jgi:hypothetical protein
VVFPAPSWNNNHYCDLTGAEAILVETRAENNFMPTADEIAPAFKRRYPAGIMLAIEPNRYHVRVKRTWKKFATW